MPFLRKCILYLFPAVTFILLLRVFFLHSYPDFSSYYYGSQAVRSGLNPYEGGRNFFTPFVYPPFVLLLFMPFSFLPYDVSQRLWVLLSLFLFLLSIYILFKQYRNKIFAPVHLVLIGFSFLYFPLKFSLGMGQLNLLILILVILSMYCLDTKKEYWSGVFLGLSISLKLFPLFFIPYLLIRRKWKIAAASLMTILTILIVDLLFLPNEVNRYFFMHDIPSLFLLPKGDYYNQSLTGVLLRQWGDTPLRGMVGMITTLLIISASGLIIFKKRNPTLSTIHLELGLIITMSLLISPFSWQHHFVWLLIPILSVIFYLKSRHYHRFYYLFPGLSFFLTGINIAHPNNYPNIIQSHVFLGAFILYCFFLYLLHKEVLIRAH